MREPTQADKILAHLAAHPTEPHSYATLAKMLGVCQRAGNIMRELVARGQIAIVAHLRAGTVYRVIASSEKAVA